MDDNHVIRIILEGRDKLSGAFKNTRKSIDSDVAAMRKSINALNKDLKETENSFQFGGGKSQRGPGGQFTSLKAARQEVEKLDKAILDLKRNNRSGLGNLFSGGTGGKNQGAANAKDFIASLRTGLKEAATTGENIRQKLSTAQADVRARKVALDAETRLGQIRLNQEKALKKQELRDNLANIKKGHVKEVDNLKIILRDKQNVSKLINAQEVANFKKEFADRKREITLLAKEQTNLLQGQKKGADPEEKNLIDRRIFAVRKARDDEIAKRKAALTDEIASRTAAAEKIRIADRIQVDDSIRKRSAELRATTAEQRTNLAKTLADQQATFSADKLAKRAAIISPDSASVRQAEQDLRKLNNAAHDTDNTFQRAGRSVGLWAGDLGRGVREGRRGLVDFGSEAQKSESRMTRLGQSVGRAVGQFGNLVNLRWFILTSAIQLVGTLVVQLGAALISVASSAAFAAASIGTVFAAAASQALPVVGLLAAAASRIQNVFKAVQLSNQNKVATAAESTAQLSATREATERLADAQYTLRQAYQAVSEAQYGLKQTGLDLVDALARNKEAILNLAQTRIEVSRAIVDAAFKERDANLALREAELGVIDAKRQLIAEEKAQKLNQADINAAKGAVREAQDRLKAAQNEADNVGVANARAQLAVAQQSLTAISITARTTNTAVKEAKVGVQRAQLTRDEAKVEKPRAAADAERLRKQGVEGNKQVIAARREVQASVRAIGQAQHSEKLARQQVAQSIHAVAIAQRELRDIEQDRARGQIGLISGQLQLKALLGQLTPGERNLYNALLRIQATYKKIFRPITDIIVGSISRAVDRANKLLQDPKLQKAAIRLATAISAGIDSISKFAVSPRFRKDLEQFFHSAATNLPTIVDSFLHLMKIFLTLATIGAPLFASFLGFIDKSSGKLDKLATSNDKTKNLFAGNFFSTGQSNLTGWIGLLKAVARLFKDLGTGSNSAGLKLVNDFTGFLNRIADWMEKHPKKVRKFFNDMATDFEKIARALGKLAPVLFKAFSSKQATDFAVFIITIVIPGLLLMVTTIQKVGQALLTLIHLPFIGTILKFGLEFLVAEKAMNKVFPVTQKITDVLKVFAFGGLKKGMLKFAEVFPALARGIRLVGGALKFVFITNPWIGAILLAITAIVLLDRKFHFLRPTIEAIQRAAKFVFDWVKNHWKLLTAIFLGPFALVAAGILKFKDKIIGIFLAIIDWVRHHWKTLATIMAALFAFPIGLIAVAILRWHDKMIGVAKKVVNGIVGWFKKLPGMILDAIKGLPGAILGVFKAIGPKILHAIIDKIPGASALLDLGGKVVGAVVKGKKAVTGFLSHPHFATGGVAPGSTDTVPAMLTPGEWVLNLMQQNKLARSLRTTRRSLSSALFGRPANANEPNPRAQNAGFAGYGFALTPTGNKLNSDYDAYSGPNFTLVPHTDDSGIPVWFAEFSDKTFGEVTVRDANRILASNGQFIPPYLMKVSQRHGGLLPGHMRALSSAKTALRGIHGSHGAAPFRMGGVAGNMRGYAGGGPVINTPAGGGRRGGNSITQHFNVHTQGETDWNYAMRLGAIHAQESM